MAWLTQIKLSKLDEFRINLYSFLAQNFLRARSNNELLTIQPYFHLLICTAGVGVRAFVCVYVYVCVCVLRMCVFACV